MCSSDLHSIWRCSYYTEYLNILCKTRRYNVLSPVKSGEDPGRMVNLSWVGGGGGGVSRAHSNWFHAVAITLPRTVKSSKWGCARAPHMSPALGHKRGHYLLPRVSLH